MKEIPCRRCTLLGATPDHINTENDFYKAIYKLLIQAEEFINYVGMDSAFTTWKYEKGYFKK